MICCVQLCQTVYSSDAIDTAFTVVFRNISYDTYYTVTQESNKGSELYATLQFVVFRHRVH